MSTVRLSPTLRRLLLHCQTECTAECCRGKAFDISVHAITSWLEAERIDRVSQLTREIKDIAERLDPKAGRLCLNERDLYSEWSIADFAAFWVRFERAFVNARETYANNNKKETETHE